MAESKIKGSGRKRLVPIWMPTVCWRTHPHFYDIRFRELFIRIRMVFYKISFVPS